MNDVEYDYLGLQDMSTALSGSPDKLGPFIIIIGKIDRETGFVQKRNYWRYDKKW